MRFTKNEYSELRQMLKFKILVAISDLNFMFSEKATTFAKYPPYF